MVNVQANLRKAMSRRGSDRVAQSLSRCSQVRGGQTPVATWRQAIVRPTVGNPNLYKHCAQRSQ
jgi:hypothetical protein